MAFAAEAARVGETHDVVAVGGSGETQHRVGPEASLRIVVVFEIEPVDREPVLPGSDPGGSALTM